MFPKFYFFTFSFNKTENKIYICINRCTQVLMYSLLQLQVNALECTVLFKKQYLQQKPITTNLSFHFKLSHSVSVTIFYFLTSQDHFCSAQKLCAHSNYRSLLLNLQQFRNVRKPSLIV